MKYYRNFLCFLIIVLIIPLSYSLPKKLEDDVYTAYFENNRLIVPVDYHAKPIILNWAALIPKVYAELDSGAIPKKLIEEFENRRDPYSYSSFFFTSPLNENLKSKHYYLISENGIDKIEVESIGVKAQYALEPKKSMVKYLNLTGYLVLDKKWNAYPGYLLISDDEKKLKNNTLPFTIHDVGEDNPVEPMLMDRPGISLKKGFSVGYKRKNSAFSFLSINQESEMQCKFIGLLIVYDQKIPMVAQWNYSKCFK